MTSSAPTPPPARSQDERRFEELVEFLMRFRGTKRAARIAADHPAEFHEATRRLIVNGGRVPSSDDEAPGPAAADEDDPTDPRAASLLDRILERLHASNERTIADRARLDAVPLPVEIRRPNLTREERITLTLATALGVAISIAVVRRAAALLGVTLTRRQTLLLIAAARTMTRGSGYHAWTRLTQPTARRPR